MATGQAEVPNYAAPLTTTIFFFIIFHAVYYIFTPFKKSYK